MVFDINNKILGERNLGMYNEKTGLTQAFENDYYSGSQIQVMLGDILLDSAIHISFQRRQNRTPVYGYANQYYTFVSDGQIFVSGELTIAFKETAYLMYPIKRYVELTANSLPTSVRYNPGKEGEVYRNAVKPTDPSKPFTSLSQQARRDQTMRANVEQMFGWGGEVTDPKNPLPTDAKGKNQFVRQLAALEDNPFEDWAEKFEDALWYGSENTKDNMIIRDQLFSGNLSEQQVFELETIMTHRNADQYPPVDIWIIYGNTSDHTANHTVKKLLDVSFLGFSQQMAASGEPIYETYSFIARNLV
jgi:hypothetical protein